MIDFGIVKPGRTLYVPFDSFSGSTGAPSTISGFAVGDIQIYKDGGTTQRASTSGFTLLDTDGIDFDGITGINGFSIDLSDNTTADFYQAGSRYFVVVSTITVDSQTVSFVACTFTIGYPDAVLNTFIATLSTQTSFTLNAGPAEDNALAGMWAVIHDAASAVQWSVAAITAYTGSTKTVTLAAGPTFTIAAKDNIHIMGPMPLQPTVGAISATGRALDCTAGGEAGVDWANVGTPSSTVSLSNTTVATVTTTTTATNVTTVNGLAANVITATSIATDAITAGKIAADAIGASELAADAVTEIQSGLATSSALTTAQTSLTDLQARVPAALGANGNIKADVRDLLGTAWLTPATAGTPDVNAKLAGGTAWGSGAITAGSIASDAITAAKIATGAIDADALAADAVSEIWTTALTESYNADGAAPTPAQALFVIMQMLTEMSISGTTMTIKKLDGSTTALTLTLNSSTTPTSVTRAT